jgi:hypothetical protein
MTNRCPLCIQTIHQHEEECPLGLLKAWSKFTSTNHLTRNLLLLNAGNLVSWQKLRVTCENLGGGELAALQFFAGTAVNIFTQIQQATTDIIEPRQTESSTAGRPDQPSASISSERAAKDSAPDAGGKGELLAPSVSADWLEKETLQPQ